jgi:hypothetical protein
METERFWSDKTKPIIEFKDIFCAICEIALEFVADKFNSSSRENNPNVNQDAET